MIQFLMRNGVFLNSLKSLPGINDQVLSLHLLEKKVDSTGKAFLINLQVSYTAI